MFQKFADVLRHAVDQSWVNNNDVEEFWKTN